MNTAGEANETSQERAQRVQSEFSQTVEKLATEPTTEGIEKFLVLRVQILKLTAAAVKTSEIQAMFEADARMTELELSNFRGLLYAKARGGKEHREFLALPAREHLLSRTMSRIHNTLDALGKNVLTFSSFDDIYPKREVAN